MLLAVARSFYSLPPPFRFTPRFFSFRESPLATSSTPLLLSSIVPTLRVDTPEFLPMRASERARTHARRRAFLLENFSGGRLKYRWLKIATNIRERSFEEEEEEEDLTMR